MTSVKDGPLPAQLAAIREDFLSLSNPEKLQLLLEFSQSLPDVPDGIVPEDAWERVSECQSPVFIHVDASRPHPTIYATAPEQAPTTRGFASILVHGLQGLSVQEIRDIPADFPLTLGLGEAVSPLRLRGMTGMLARIQRQLDPRAK